MRPFGKLFGDSFSPTAVPRITSAAFTADLFDVVLYDAIPVTEDRTTGLDLIESGPKRSSLRVFGKRRFGFALSVVVAFDLG
jgi:hypothetical protein